MKGEKDCERQLDMMRIYINDAADKINKSGKDALAAYGDGDELRVMMMGLKRFTKTTTYNAKEARRKVADKMIAENKYCF